VSKEMISMAVFYNSFLERACRFNSTEAR